MTSVDANKNKPLRHFIPSANLIFFSAHFILIALCESANSRNIIKNLPGYDGELPFRLETGYIGVGEGDKIQLFYYFVESQRSPSEDPFLFWLTGGPGCSCLSPLFFQNGPLKFNFIDYDGIFPTLSENPYAWTETMNILFIDAPAGTGFSYPTTQEGYYSDDYTNSAQDYQFLRKFLMDHPRYLANDLYVGGDSYAGMIVPMVVNKIISDNIEGLTPLLNLKGYLLGNPLTDLNIDSNSKIDYAHRMTLISDPLYESAKSSCKGDYVNVNPSNAKCTQNVASIWQLLRNINDMHILESYCYCIYGQRHKARRSLFEVDPGVPLIFQAPLNCCREYMYNVFVETWANDESVREALHVRPGTKWNWVRCNYSISYNKNAGSVVPYHRILSTNTTLRSLVYSGDHDLWIPHIGTQIWINSLNMIVDDSWRTWYVDREVAGYTEKYLSRHSSYSMVFATVKGAGHIAPEYLPKQVTAMINRWFANNPL